MRDERTAGSWGSPRNGLTEIKTWAMYVYRDQHLVHPDLMQTYIYLPVLKPLLQVFIDTLVRNGGEQRHIRDSHLLLLESFLPIGLP